MSILRIATAQADMTAFGGNMSTNTNFFDPERVEECFQLSTAEVGVLDFPAAAGNETWLHFAYGQDGNSDFNDETVVRIRDAANDQLAYIRVGGANLYFGINGDVSFEGGATSISVNNDFIIDIQIIVNGAVDITVRGYINSALQFDSTQANTAAKTNPTQIEFLNPSVSFPHEKFSAELIMADEDTRGFRLRELKPQSFGVFQQWDGTVASIIDDSLATGVSTDVADERVSFGVSNLENVDPGDIINRVVAQSYAQRGTSGLTSFNHFFRYDDATIQDGSDISLGLFGDWYVDEYVNNPKTAAPWVPADLAGIQLGLRART